MKRTVFLFLLWVMVTAVYAQRPDFTKMSAMVRSLALDASSSAGLVALRVRRD